MSTSGRLVMQRRSGPPKCSAADSGRLATRVRRRGGRDCRLRTRSRAGGRACPRLAVAALDERRVPPRAGRRPRRRTSADRCPAGPDPAEVVDLLAGAAEPGLMAIQSGRFFGWVMGGTLPAALAADWLVSAWDQNAGMRYATPAVAALEEVAGTWLLDLLGLPADADVGFVTGATMANFTGLAAGRDAVLAGPAGTCDAAGCSAHRGARPGRRRAARHASTWRCGTWASAPPRSSRPTSRAGSGWTRSRRPSTGADRGAGDRRACRPETSTPAPSTRSRRRSHDRAPARRVGARRRRVRPVGGGLPALADLVAGWKAPTPGPPTHTRR